MIKSPAPALAQLLPGGLATRHLVKKSSLLVPNLSNFLPLQQKESWYRRVV